MDRWEIRATGTDDDPDRHLLLIQGGPADVAALIKKFGALFGRPTPYQGAEFNLSLVLHGLDAKTRERLESWLRQRAPAVEPQPSRATAEAVSSPPSPVPPAFAPAPAPLPVAAPITLAPPPAVPMEPAGEVPLPPIPVPIPAPIPLAPLPEVLAAAAPPIPELKPREPEIPPLIDLNAVPSPPPTPTPMEVPAPEPLAPPAATPVPAAVTVLKPVPESPPLPTPTPMPAPAAASPASLVLRSDWSMDSLHVGAYNRFAHAAATQVISSPGTMYNPLFLFGVPGTGKSHLLHALAHALSNEKNGAGIFITSGPRLSRAVSAALAANNTAPIDALVAEARALLIDDIHLMSVSELNKNALAKIFKSFFDRKLQVVITSGYPPKALAALEESLKFSFSRGWSVDLKVPGPAAQKELIGAAADRSGRHFGSDEIGLLHEKLSVWGYQELSQWLHRFGQFKKQREAAAQPGLVSDMLPLIYEPVLAGGGEAPQAGASFQPPPVAAGAASLAVIVPKDQLGLSTFVAGRFHEVGAKNGMNRSYRHALWESYDAQQPFGAPFMIGDLCERAAVTHVLVLGPAPESALGPRATEFAHAVRHILENLGMEMGWIPFSGATIDANYLNAHLDFIADPARTA